MKLITLDVTEFHLKNLDELVKLGRYPNRAEAIRMAINDLIRSELLDKKMIGVDVKPECIEIREERQVWKVKVEREQDGKIWGVYPNYVEGKLNDTISNDATRNLLILFQHGILCLKDFPRAKKREKNI